MIISKNVTLIIYLVSFLSTFILAFLSFKFEGKGKITIRVFNSSYRYSLGNLFFYIIPIVLIVLNFIRINVGTDFLGYKMYYDCIVGNIEIKLEYFYKLINQLAILIFGDFYGVLFFTALITNFFVIRALKNYLGKYFPVGVLLYCLVYYLSTFNGIRQMIGVSIVFYAFKFIVKKNWKAYLGLCFIASLFHKTAIMCSAFYFINKIEHKKLTIKKFFYYILLLTAPFYLQYVLKIVTKILLPQYGSYIGESGVVGVGFLLQYIFPILLIILVEINIINLKDYNEYEIFKNIFLITIALRTLGYMNEYLARLSWYSEIVQIVVVVLIIKNVKKVYQKYLLIILSVSYYFYYFWQTYYISNFSETFPYIINQIFIK